MLTAHERRHLNENGGIKDRPTAIVSTSNNNNKNNANVCARFVSITVSIHESKSSHNLHDHPKCKYFFFCQEADQ
jgi:hypothetical protein